MVDRIYVELLGFEDVKARLKEAQIPATPARFRKILMQGADIMHTAIAQRAPWGEGRKRGRHLRHGVFHFGYRAPKRRWAQSVLVGMNAGGGGIAPHAYIVEYGTKERFVTTYMSKPLKKPASRGRMPARPYFWPGVRASQGAALAQIETTLKRMIEYHLKKREAAAERMAARAAKAGG